MEIKMDKIWKQIGESEYFANDVGEIAEKLSNGFFEIKKQYLNRRRGYYYVNIQEDGIYRLRLVHRLVAQAFIPNPENKREVDHIDSCPTNNKVSNLRWVTPKENQNNEYSKAKHRKRVVCLNTGEIYESVTDACQKNGIINGVSDVCNGKRKQCYGLRFKFI
jgi:hypothetical protein